MVFLPEYLANSGCNLFYQCDYDLKNCLILKKIEPNFTFECDLFDFSVTFAPDSSIENSQLSDGKRIIGDDKCQLNYDCGLDLFGCVLLNKIVPGIKFNCDFDVTDN